jgi:hypothetical protein
VSLPVVFPNHEAAPLAWTGSLLGVSKSDSDQLVNAIWFGVYDANGNQVAGDKLAASTSAKGPLKVVWNGSEFALFYTTPSTTQLTMQRIDVNANPIGGPVSILPGHAIFPGQDFDFVWDATRNAYVILRSVASGFERGVWLSVVGADGSTKSDEVLSFNIADPTQPRIAVTPGGVLGLLWNRLVGGEAELAFAIGAPGKPLTTIVTVKKAATNGLVASDGRFFLVVYESPASGGTSEIRSVKYDLTGRVVASDAQLIAPSGIDVVPYSLIANNTLGEWALLYVDAQFGALSTQPADTRLRRIPYDTTVPQSDTLFAPDQTKRNLLPTGNLVFAGSRYAAPVGRYLSRAEGSESYIVFHCPLTVSITAQPPVANPNQPVTLTAIVQGGTGPYSVSWTFGDLNSASGTTASHAYRDVGNYVATATVHDQAGGVTLARFTVQIANLKHRAARK